MPVKLIKQGEKREISTKICNETMHVARQVEGFCISYFAALSSVELSRTIPVEH